MNTSPYLSVIIPTYNRAALLRKSINSVFEQTFPDYEIIVIDDGSTDRTEETIAQLLNDTPEQRERVRYLFQRNQGKSVALNNALREAKGEWIAFLDSDDLWLPTKIEEQFRVLRNFSSQSEACITDAQYINNPFLSSTAFQYAGRQTHERIGVLTDPVGLISNPNGIFMQTLLLHSRVVRNAGGFDPTLRVIHDIDFIFRVSIETRLSFVNSPLVLIDRTPKRSEGLIEILVRNDPPSLSEQQSMFEKWLPLGEALGQDAQKTIRSHLRGIHSKWANWFLKNRQYREACRAVSKAARMELTPGTAAKWCLTTMAPALARRIVIQRSRHGQTPGMLEAMGGANERDETARPTSLGAV